MYLLFTCKSDFHMANDLIFVQNESVQAWHKNVQIFNILEANIHLSFVLVYKSF